MKSRKWRLSAMEEFNNKYNTCFADGKSYGLNKSRAQHCFVNLIGEFSNKNVKEKLATSSNDLFNCGWRLTKVKKDATAIGWQQVTKPPGGWPGLTLPSDLVHVIPKDFFWIRFVEAKKKDGVPAQSIEQVLLSYHLSGLVSAAKSIGMSPSDLNNRVQQAYGSGSSQPLAIHQPPPPQATAGDIAKWPSQPPALPPFDMENPDDVFANGTELSSIIGGGNTSGLLMAAALPDQAAARKVIEGEAAALAVDPASVEAAASARKAIEDEARKAACEAAAAARAKEVADKAAREARAKESADNDTREAEVAAAARAKEVEEEAEASEDDTTSREADRVGEIRNAVGNAKARSKLNLGAVGSLFYHQYEDGIYTGTVNSTTSKGKRLVYYLDDGSSAEVKLADIKKLTPLTLNEIKALSALIRTGGVKSNVPVTEVPATKTLSSSIMRQCLQSLRQRAEVPLQDLLSQRQRVVV